MSQITGPKGKHCDMKSKTFGKYLVVELNERHFVHLQFLKNLWRKTGHGAKRIQFGALMYLVYTECREYFKPHGGKIFRRHPKEG